MPFADIAFWCRAAAREAPGHILTSDLPVFSKWDSRTEAAKRKLLEAFSLLLIDLSVQNDAAIVLCSRTGLVVRPSRSLLSLDGYGPDLSLDHDHNAFLAYLRDGSRDYRYLDRQSWCVRFRRTALEDFDHEVDELTGRAFQAQDGRDVVARQFVGWSLATKRDPKRLTAEAILEDRVEGGAIRNVIISSGRGPGRPELLTHATEAYVRLFPAGHEAKNMTRAQVLAALKAAGIEIGLSTLDSVLRSLRGPNSQRGSK